MDVFFESLARTSTFLWNMVSQQVEFIKSIFNAMGYIVSVVALLPGYIKAIVLSLVGTSITLSLLNR